MHPRFIRPARFLPALLLVLWAAPALAAGAPADWHIGVGTSSLADPEAAGAEAAKQAKAGLGGEPAKFVFVGAAEAQLTPALLRGVLAHFDAATVYGCQVTSPLTPETNFPDVKTIDVTVGVGVLALGGGMEVEVFSHKTDTNADDPYYEAGQSLGDLARPSLERSKSPGRLLLTFGDQYNGSNIEFVNGLNDSLEEIYPIIGAAAGNNTAKEIVKGEIVTGENLVVFLGGDFRLGQSMRGGTHTPETADETLSHAISQGGGAEPFFALIFNCRRRRQGMIDRQQLGEEHAAMKKDLPGIPFFGFYAPGEVGAEANGQRAKGAGFTVSTAVFFPK